MTAEQIESLCAWGPPRITPTKYGERIRRDARLNVEVGAAFELRTEELKKHSITLRRATRYFIATHWQPVPTAVAKQREESLQLSSAGDADIEIPCRPGLEYRGYQRAGCHYILEKFKTATPGVLLGDEMGVGKTIQAIMVINADTRIHRVLIVPPAKLKGNWYAELQRWLTRNLSVGIVDSKCFPSTDIVICNFEMLHKFPKSTAFYWDLIICDEIHRLKDPTTKRARALFGGRKTSKAEACSAIPARRKLGLTGTPIPNKVIEIFPALNWLNPQEWGNMMTFGFRYCNARKTRFGWDLDGSANLDELSDRLRRSCFDGDTEIASQYGNIKIREIVYRKLQIKVWSVDAMGCKSLRDVVGWSCKENRELLVKISFAGGFIVCTKDHRIYTRKGQIRAGEIKEGDYMRALRSEIGKVTDIYQPDSTKSDVLFHELRGKESNGATTEGFCHRERNDAENNSKGVRTMQSGIRREKQKSLSVATLLHGELSGKMDVSGVPTEEPFTQSERQRETITNSARCEETKYLEESSRKNYSTEPQEQHVKGSTKPVEVSQNSERSSPYGPDYYRY